MSRLIDADVLKRKAQKEATEAWKMKITAKVETILNQFIDWIDNAPTIEQELSIPISWIEGHIDWLKDMDNGFASITAMNIETMLRKWREEQNETD